MKLFAIVMSTLATVTLVAGQAPAVLRNARISFHTNNEDKDDDTHVTVTLVDSNGVTAALLSNDLGHFDDNSDEGPYALTILNPSQEALLQSGRIRLRIDPNGHDTWRFNFFLEMIFSDGSRLSGGANSLELTQNRKQQEFGIDGIVQRVN
ncbi:hypothetical protein NQ176_g3063 [Zarea fungicola]|uniref:Uncharacterized protein n=1 Tax=Zarea fungicola TaxID=93591 RepID=A0ACC1NLQ2_9HYPO|nr:hypothetical protein NQ176_g3063 [Lecanicillium fungicola]